MSKEFPSMDGVHPEGSRASPARRIHYRQWGIYTVAYMPSDWAFWKSMSRSFAALRESAPHAIRFSLELCGIFPFIMLLFTLIALWKAIAPAFGLFILSIVLDSVFESIQFGKVDHRLQSNIVVWLFSAFLACLGARLDIEVRHRVRAHLRLYFLPQLARARLGLDVMQCIDGRQHGYPAEWDYNDHVPGWQFLEVLEYKVTNRIAFLCEIATFIVVVRNKPLAEKCVLVGLCVAHLVVAQLLPVNDVNGAGYVWWTENPHHKRLQNLFRLIFSDEYRTNIATDGVGESLHREFENASRSLGLVKDSTFHLGFRDTGLCRAWYWSFISDLIGDIPMVLYVFALPWILSHSSMIYPIASMALLQHATHLLSRAFVRMSTEDQSFAATFQLARTLYTDLERSGTANVGCARYPDPLRSSTLGMAISVRDLSVQYPGRSDKILDGLSLDILPGQLVVIVGERNSGKTTLVNLLSRVQDPTSGSIFMDGLPSSTFDLDELRASMAFLSQTPNVYPVSMEENIRLGLKTGGSCGHDTVVEAAKLGGALDFIQKLERGFDTELDPLSNTGISYDSGPIPQELMDHCVTTRIQPTISLSQAEKQRLSAARTFMRLRGSDIRLLVVDEPSSSLSPQAEMELSDTMREHRQGKTMLFITRRFSNLMQHADVILCMKHGRIVERGTHAQLKALKGSEYNLMYEAQYGEGCISVPI